MIFKSTKKYLIKGGESKLLSMLLGIHFGDRRFVYLFLTILGDYTIPIPLEA